MALRPGQLKCIQTLDKPIVVAAGAGSGKTFTLTKRIAGALESGYVDDIGQVCAITFTNKAAAELKSRVKRELRACGMVEQALKADDAWISTIHGMCARILRSHAVELGIDPSFKMADAAQADLLLDAAIDEVLREAAGGPLPGAGDATGSVRGNAAIPDAAAVGALFGEYPARSQGYSGSSVEAMLRMLVKLASASKRGVDAFWWPKRPVNAARLADAVVGAYEDLLAAARREKPSKSRDEWLAATAEAADAARAVLDRGGADDPKAALGLVAGLRCSKKFGSREFKGRVDECMQEAGACIMELRLAAARPHLDTLVGLAGEVLARFSARKRRAGVLDNDDLLVLAARALEEHADIAAAYADKFRLVMVDEFQDTDQMQVDMIKRISGPGSCRLCTVGDAQQSIYRFRGADVSVYRRHLESVREADPDGIILLPDNFRSHADVLALVDRVFEREDMFGGEFMSLNPGRDEPGGGRPFGHDAPRIQVQLTTKAAYRGVPAADVTAEQARRIADAFAQMRDAGHPAGDMAVLLGRMTNADVYAKALRDRGLACVVAGGSVFKDAPEVGTMLELARVAVNPRDTEALYAVLAGPLFRVPDDDLLALATRWGEDDGAPHKRTLDEGLRAFQLGMSRECPGAGEGASPQLGCAARVIGDLCRRVASGPLSRALMDAIADSGWISRLQAEGAEGLAVAGNIYKAVRMVEGIERDAVAGPLGVLRAFESTLELSKEAPGALSAAGGDFVRIMTVHASKGLEFPIVAVVDFKDVSGDFSRLLASQDGAGRILLSLDLDRSRSSIGGSAALRPEQEAYPAFLAEDDDEESLLARARDASGALELRAALYGHGRLGDAEEAKRLLYVALTRARECLVVSMAGARSKDNPNGTPRNCLGAVVAALEKSGGGFEAGTTSYDFGGSAPAVVHHVALQADAAPQGDADDETTGGSPGESDGRPFAVPAPLPHAASHDVPYSRVHEGVFSYSSVAEASHGGDLLQRLAGRFAVDCDAADPALPETPSVAPAAEALELAGVPDPGRAEGGATFAVGDDGGRDPHAGRGAPDADKATDFGTAFHRLAQLAVVSRKRGDALARPGETSVRALMRANGLGKGQRERLEGALARWFGSDEARIMEAWGPLRAEVPFLIAIDAAGAGAPVFLEGEIDLLALDAGRGRARVVDYKTGGRADEAEGDLMRKHVLQASCYALALLRQGMKQVDASFVRVERPRADDASQPQCVRYRFEAADAATLERAIARAYAQSRER